MHVRAVSDLRYFDEQDDQDLFMSSVFGSQ